MYTLKLVKEKSVSNTQVGDPHEEGRGVIVTERRV